MTEADWLACDDPGWMDLFLSDRGKVSNRKFRLFGLACVRDVWDGPAARRPASGGRDVRAVRGWPRDGGGTPGGARRGRRHVRRHRGHHRRPRPSRSRPFATGAVVPDGGRSSAGIAAVAAEARSDWGTAWEQAKQLHCRLFRDVFGNPFRPVTLDPSWLTPSVRLLAEDIYADRAFDRLPILSDALQDAGCENDDILSHCLGGGPHVLGCWVVDLVLNKE